jgi:tetratricopeptide (TPR) repeat protein
MKTYPPGFRIAGRYEVAGRPLLGGMGVVYLCFDHQEQRPVALKTFRPEYLPDRAVRDRFLREGTIWMDFGRHPHIVHCYQVSQTGVGPEVYLVLELVAKEEGHQDASLRSWLIPGRPLPVEQALLFALQIARGIAHAGSVIPSFVHRDLKPENVLVGADKLSNAAVNRLRVTDFGLAAVLQEAGSRLQVIEEEIQGGRMQLGRTQLTRGVVGTPPYMAPEQWRGEDVTVQTDVYALGCILYEMLAGQRAVEGNSLAALERAHCDGKTRPLPDSLPEVVKETVADCLEVEPELRYAGWGALEEALAAAYARVTGRVAPAPALAQALDLAERVAVGWSYSEIGLSYLDIGKVKVALGYFEQAREVGRSEGERHLEGAGSTGLGLAYADLGDVHRAIRCYEQALAIDREIGDRRGEGADLGNLGNAYIALGDARRAIEFYERQLEITREIGDRRGEQNAFGGLGNAYVDLGDLRQAIKFFEQRLAIAREIGDRRGEGNALGDLGNAYADLGDSRRAIRFHKQALTISRETGDRRGEGADLGNLGAAYFDLGDAQRAIGFHEKALVIHREIGDRYGEGNVLGNLGNAYAHLGDLQQAIDFYEQALAVRREIRDMMGVARDSYNMALLYARQGERDQALHRAQQAAEIWRKLESSYAQQAQQLMALIRGIPR